jgi:glycosyltransferase involved in cell wall biosynthesis
MIAGEVASQADARLMEHDADLAQNGLRGLREAWRVVRHMRHADVTIIPYGPYRMWASRGWQLPQLLVIHLGLRRRTVTVLHDAYPPESRWRSEWWALAIGAVISGALVVHGEHERAKLRRIPRAGRAAVIPIFIEERSLPSRAEARRRLGISEACLVLAMIGWIHPRKNCELAIRTLAKVGGDARLWLVGATPDRTDEYLESLHALARDLGVADRVQQTGFVSETELDLRLAAADIGLCPYHDISASASLSTLLAARRPVIATDLPVTRELRELAPEGVVIADGLDTDCFAEAVSRVLSHPPAADSFDALLEARSLAATARAYRAGLSGVARSV